MARASYFSGYTAIKGLIDFVFVYKTIVLGTIFKREKKISFDDINVKTILGLKKCDQQALIL